MSKNKPNYGPSRAEVIHNLSSQKPICAVCFREATHQGRCQHHQKPFKNQVNQ